MKRKLLTQDYERGGLKSIDIEILQKSLILKWVKRLLVGNESWKVIPSDVINSFGAHFAILNRNINFNGIQNEEKNYWWTVQNISLPYVVV